MFDRVKAGRQTHAECYIVAVGLAAYVGQIHASSKVTGMSTVADGHVLLDFPDYYTFYLSY